ncbi:unnamed protein product [Larinioides sclopetarius]|uniref:Secreted protein n=1 Tax=Larinioides sclopetarius TaxID=280406 RepID=A0AAV2AFV8_9ARAC
MGGYKICSILVLFVLSHSVTGNFLGESDVYHPLQGIDAGRGGLSGRVFDLPQGVNTNVRRQVRVFGPPQGANTNVRRQGYYNGR